MQKITDKYEMSYIRKMGNPETHKIENELIIILPVGCYWAKSNGGCSYCGYQDLVDEMNGTTHPFTYLDILRTEISKQTEKIERISFFVGGSFLEIPRHIQLELFHEVNKYTEVKEVCIETRPELVSKDHLLELKSCLNGKGLQVAFGVESSNEFIRNSIHKKGLDEKTYETAINILHECNIKTLIYVFVKPPIAGITDGEAIKDAMDTIKDSFAKGAYAVELECGYIVENSEMYDLYMEGKYKPLTFWSIQNLLQEAIELNQGIVRLAYFSDTPKPVAGPSNCEYCDAKFNEMFDEYRKTLDKNIIYRNIECNCKES